MSSAATGREPRSLRVEIPDATVEVLEWGGGNDRLAVLQHGFPDTSWTWRHLGPVLAEHGWRVVAPALRGYGGIDRGVASPSAVMYADDLDALHAALGGDDRAVLIGHDWGAIAATISTSRAASPWRRVVLMSVPPMPSLGRGLRTVGVGPLARQVRNSWYVAVAQVPGLAVRVLPRAIGPIWRHWSPELDSIEDVARLHATLDSPPHWRAATGPYRALLRAALTGGPPMGSVPMVPTLYLHGSDDGCLEAGLSIHVLDVLPAGSRAAVLIDAGHFLHLDQPAEVANRILAFLAVW